MRLIQIERRQQGHCGSDQQRGVYDRVPTDAKPFRGGVGIRISAEQHGLKEDDARVPH